MTSRTSSSEAVHAEYRRRVRRVATGLAVLAAAVTAAIAAVVTIAVGGSTGAVATVAVVVAVLVFVSARRWGDRPDGRPILDRVGARPLEVGQHPRVHNLVEGRCLSSGVAPPELFVIDTAERNALAVGGRVDDRALVFTSGLLDSLDRIELEAVVAWLVARLRSGEAETSLRLISLCARYRLPGALRRALVEWAVPADLVESLDTAACQLTRYPPGLAAALERVAEPESGSAAGVEVTAATGVDGAHLWLVPPGGPGGHLAAATHRPLSERISETREL